MGQLGGHIHECTHCRPFWRSLRNGAFEAQAPALERDVECPQCGRPLVVLSANGAHRCVECGIADLTSEGHVTELWWSEDPDAHALNIGWGGSDIWACACGDRYEDGAPAGERWAREHADANGGRVRTPTAPT